MLFVSGLRRPVRTVKRTHSIIGGLLGNEPDLLPRRLKGARGETDALSDGRYESEHYKRFMKFVGIIASIHGNQLVIGVFSQ